jgi:hypothetical protein
MLKSEFKEVVQKIAEELRLASRDVDEDHLVIAREHSRLTCSVQFTETGALIYLYLVVALSVRRSLSEHLTILRKRDVWADFWGRPEIEEQLDANPDLVRKYPDIVGYAAPSECEHARSRSRNALPAQRSSFVDNVTVSSSDRGQSPNSAERVNDII